MPEQHAIGLWHLVATGGGGMLFTLIAVWRTWIKPAQDARTANEVRLTRIETRLDSGDKRFDSHSEKDDKILEKLDRIEERLRKLEQAFAGVAPALTKES